MRKQHLVWTLVLAIGALASFNAAAQPNKKPSAKADTATTTVGTAVTINVLSNDSDPNGDALTLNTVNQGSKGSVAKSGNSAVYTPKPGVSGTDSFTYTIKDSKGAISSSATVSVTITAPPNAAPVANGDSISTTAPNAGSVDLLANDTDANGDTLSVTANTQGSKGAVTRSGGTATYTPNPGTSGNDSFNYTVSDGKGGTATISVSVSVAPPPNTAPVASDDSISTTAPSAGSVNLLANDTDANDDTLSVTGNTQGSKGSVTRSGGTATYTPNAGTSGSDSFTYTVSDGNGGTATGTVSVSVAPPPNTAPVASDDSISTTAPSAGSVNLLANDTDANDDTLSVTGNTQGSKGSVTRSGGTATYTPNAGTSGSDSFTYTISDGNGGTATGTVSVSVAPPPNTEPVANNDTITTTAGTPVSINVAANDTDADGDTLVLNGKGQGTHGATTASGTTVTYTPEAGYTGTDKFGYTISDARGGMDSANVNITVTAGANTPPVANPDTASTTAPAAVSVNLLTNDTDANGDTLSVTGNTQGSKGAVTRSGGNATYTPNAGTSGSDSFTYTVSDGKGGTATGTVTVTVAAAPNAAPVAGADSISTAAPNAGSVNLLANDTDANGDTLSVTANTQGTKGSVTRSGGTATYTPNAGTSGSDSFTYTVSDGKGGTATGTVAVTVTGGANVPPVANNDTITTTAGTPVSINVAANDTDANGDTLVLNGKGQGTHGATTASGTTVTYTPAAGYTGTDKFGYTISDARGGMDSANVNITVTAGTGTNTPPVANPDTASTTAPAAVSVNLLSNDTDANGDTLSVTANTQGSKGTVTRSGGTATYTPNAGSSGADSFSYTVSDGKGGTASGTVTVTIAAGAPTGTGTASLNWVVPTTREDGSPMPASELAGYEIYVLDEGTGQSSVITVPNPLATSYTVNNLGTGTYHFSMAAKDTSGHLSALSTVVTKTVSQ